MPPFAALGLAVFLGSALACCVGVLPSYALCAVLFLLGIVLFFRRMLPHRELILLVLFGAALSLFRCAFAIQTDLLPLKELEGQTHIVSGQITDVVPGDGNVRYTVQASFPESTLKGTQRIYLWAKGDYSVGEIGDTVRGEAYFYPMEADTIFERTAEASYRIAMRGFLREGSFSQSRFWRIETFFSVLRKRISKTIAYSVPGQAGALTNALLCGDRTYLDTALERDILVTGLTHLLSISGSHLSIVILMLRRLVKKRSLPVRTAICLFGIIFYALLTGASYAVTRAAVMCTLLLLAELLGRGYDGVNALGAAAFLIVLMEPFSAVSVSLWYSCAASLSILLIVSPVMRYFRERFALEYAAGDVRYRRWSKKAIAYILTSLCASTAASLAVLPISWIAGNTISLLSPLSTLLAGVFLPVIVSGGLLIFLTAPIPFLSAIAALFTRIVSSVLIVFIEALAEIPYASLPKGHMWIGPCLLASGVMLLVCYLWRRQKGILAAGISLCVITWSGSYLAGSILTEDLTRVIVPAETACAVISQGNTHLLVGTIDSDYEADLLAETLRDYGIRELQLVLLGDWAAASMEAISREAEIKLLCTCNTIGAGLERYADRVLPLQKMELAAGETFSAEILSLPVDTGFAVSLQIDGAGMLIFYPEYDIMNIDAYPSHTILLLPEKPAEGIGAAAAQFGVVTVHTDEYNINNAPVSLQMADASERDVVFYIRDGAVRLTSDS